MMSDREPRLSFLEPLDASGTRCAFWCKLVEHQLASGKSVGRSVARPPSESLLGVGSYGRVWRARDRHSGCMFAVKNVEDAAAEQELRVLRHLRHFAHPCVLRFYGEESFPDVRLTSLYLELCPGGDLLSVVATARTAAVSNREPYKSPEHAQCWLVQTFSALEYLHLVADVLHLDVKLGNVLLDDGGRAKLADFGLSRLGVSPAPAWTVGNLPPGSPGYAAPEVLAGLSCDAKADLFSFGMLTWVLFTGGAPDQPEPAPPQSRRCWEATSPDPESPEAASKWMLMQQEIRAHLAHCLPRVRAFVLDLLHWSPADRPCHDDLRRQALLNDDEAWREAGRRSHRGCAFMTDKQLVLRERKTSVLVECN